MISTAYIHHCPHDDILRQSCYLQRQTTAASATHDPDSLLWQHTHGQRNNLSVTMANYSSATLKNAFATWTYIIFCRLQSAAVVVATVQRRLVILLSAEHHAATAWRTSRLGNGKTCSGNAQSAILVGHCDHQQAAMSTHKPTIDESSKQSSQSRLQRLKPVSREYCSDPK